jgi:hypothetical protein
MNKELAVAVFCYCCQGERSVHRSIGSAAQWFGFLGFYDDSKRAGLDWILSKLKELGAHQHQPVHRDDVYTGTFATWLMALMHRMFQVHRTSKHVSAPELAFIQGTIAKLVEYLGYVEPPPSADLVELRMDLLTCQCIIGRRVGSQRLRQFHSRVTDITKTLLRVFVQASRNQTSNIRRRCDRQRHQLSHTPARWHRPLPDATVTRK